MLKKKRVICAISGGVDSAVAAAILKKMNFSVIGVFLKFWTEPQDSFPFLSSNRCCSFESEIRAREIAKILKIPFYLLDFSKEFKERVVEDFFNKLKRGFTPNPCIVCNREIKFGLLMKKSLELGADFLATGHYAKKVQDKKLKTFKLLRARDKKKDQSYFLWTLTQEKLKKIIFPLGELKREKVERLAEKFNLPLAGVRKSVELCFVKNRINSFLEKYLGKIPGKIVDKTGKILGEHPGIWFYTIGQRRGLNLSSGPYYVLDKDPKKNLLVVTNREEDLYSNKLIAEDVNWIAGKEPKFPLKVKAKIRYLSDLAPATILKLDTKRYEVLFQTPQRAITPGQSVVFYKRDEVLGGGVICFSEEKM